MLQYDFIQEKTAKRSLCVTDHAVGLCSVSKYRSLASITIRQIRKIRAHSLLNFTL